jgi:hypothetical protein
MESRPNRRGNVPLFVTLAVALLTFAVTAHAAPTTSVSAGPAVIQDKHGNPIGSPTNLANLEFHLAAYSTSDMEIDFKCSVDSTVLFSQCTPTLLPGCIVAPLPTAATGVTSATGPTSGPTNKLCRTWTTISIAADGDHVFRALTTECAKPCDPLVDGVDGPPTAIPVVIDRTPPVVTLMKGPTIHAPALKASDHFVYTANENASFKCLIDGHRPTECQAGFPHRSVLPLDGVHNGTHKLTIVARDQAGNLGAAVSRKFAVDLFKAKRCVKASRGRGAAQYRACKKSNAAALRKWKQKHHLK